MRQGSSAVVEGRRPPAVAVIVMGVSGSGKSTVGSLLYPARLLYSWTTGAMASNDHAVEFVRRHSIPDLDVDLIERALQCRRENGDLDRLFPERSKLEHQYSVCATVISRS